MRSGIKRSVGFHKIREGKIFALHPSKKRVIFEEN